MAAQELIYFFKNNQGKRAITLAVVNE